MARAFKSMQARAARGRRSTINDSFPARIFQVELFAFELAAYISKRSEADDDVREACAEFMAFMQEMNRAK